MYAFSKLLIIFKIKFVRRTDYSHSLGHVIIHMTGCVGYRTLSNI